MVQSCSFSSLTNEFTETFDKFKSWLQRMFGSMGDALGCTHRACLCFAASSGLH